jgi:hypothetical protein
MKMHVTVFALAMLSTSIFAAAQPAGRGAPAQPAAGRGAPAGPPNLGKPPTDTPGKVEIVVVIGCVREQGPDNWMLVAATDPLVSTANAPARSEVPTTPPTGKNQFKLTGVGEFALPTHKDHTVLVKALYNKAMPVTRLNITSLVEAVSACSPDAPK